MILICDDDSAIRSSLELVLKRVGYETASVSNPKDAVDFIRKQTPQLILMDMNYSHSTSGEEGLTLLKQTKIFCPDVPVILITAWGSINLAVRGIQAGAFDFVTKPWNNIALINTIQTALQLNNKPDDKVEPVIGETSFNSDKIIGKSPLLKNVFNTIARIAPTNAAVLITGESGTGKELIAEAIHENSKRKNAPFVKVNLGGISQSLFESEMFGHKKGAFTDAHYDRIGRFEMANKGSIFLDEIGDLDAACQVKLLRVLQDQTFESLGDSKTKQTDVRIISATNKNLSDMVAKGTFREDLFYRINLISIRVPALRERLDDVPLLVDYFVKRQQELNGLSNIEISAEAISFLQSLPYPGNIRELKNLVERTILVSGKSVISDKDFKEQYNESPAADSSLPDSVYPLEELEKNMILKAMSLYGNNLSKVAIALGLTRQALYRRLEKYDISYNKE
ncbi:sigma-54 dependent transcriptional regulator [Dysgonomonas sp. 25]|uniref:sigma-54-dependent transcriptional regulator n=1 Tax=Dysgonomonas sp. 25 TaxID=2302933 RepID=UPI0013D7E48D|nr:sigma-54 dependent transcriptional regulator [Dysgonomonas sp. 25]NDV67880.1 sigma-54-dependent Fis family transcriptional regulator [Dysgonomonas sp. 25]